MQIKLVGKYFYISCNKMSLTSALLSEEIKESCFKIESYDPEVDTYQLLDIDSSKVFTVPRSFVNLIVGIGYLNE